MEGVPRYFEHFLTCLLTLLYTTHISTLAMHFCYWFTLPIYTMVSTTKYQNISYNVDIVDDCILISGSATVSFKDFVTSEVNTTADILG